MSKSITSNVLWKFAERITAQIVSFVISLLLARILCPEDYGTVAIVMVFITIANVFVSNGFGAALIQKKDADNLDFSSVFYFNICFSLLLYLIIFFASPLISKFYGNNDLTLIFRVLGIRIIFAAINSVQQAYISKNMMFKKFFLATLFGTGISGIIGLAFAYMGFGAWALVFQYLTNTIVDTFVLSHVISWKPTNDFSFRRVINLLKFGWKILFEGLSETIVSQLKTIIIGKVYTASDLGYFSKAQQFPSLVMTNISSSIGAVLFSAMSAEQDKQNAITMLMRKSVKVCSYVLFPVLTGLALTSPNLIPVLLTDKWIETVPYLYILSFSALLTVGMYPRHQAMKAIGRSDIYMNEHIIVRIVSIVLLIFTYKIGVMAIAVLEILNNSILTLVLMYTSYKYNNYKYKEQIIDVLPIVIMNIIMGCAVYGVNYIDTSYLGKLIIQVTVGISVYLILSVIIKPEGYEFTKSYIFRFWNKRK